jgi:hypothetical protein
MMKKNGIVAFMPAGSHSFSARYAEQGVKTELFKNRKRGT